jgi:type III secretion protein V
MRVLAGLVPGDMVDGTGSIGQVSEDMSEVTDAAQIGRAVDATVVACYRAIMGQAEALFDLQQLERALERARRRHPAVVREALKVLALPELLGLCRGLLRERLPLPPLAALLEVVASEPRLRLVSERARWGELVREQLAGLWLRDLVAAHARLGPLRWVRPQPETEAELRARTREGEGGLRLTLGPGERAAWLSELRGGSPESPLVVTTPGARAMFAALVRGSAPHITVLSTAELAAVELPVPGEPGGPAARWCVLG